MGPPNPPPTALQLILVAGQTHTGHARHVLGTEIGNEEDADETNLAECSGLGPDIMQTDDSCPATTMKAEHTPT
jgi:hypothetical protein